MGSVRRGKNKEYYAVVKGRIDEPTIFSSWGDAHPRVTGCPAKYKAYFTIDEARIFMEENGVSQYKEIIKSTALETTPERGSMAYYAVAYGAKPGIHTSWSGETGASVEVHEISGACHKRFRTEAQAKAFIEDWKESFAEVWRRAIKEGLDQGLKPRDMKLSMDGLLDNGDEETTGGEIADQLDRLRLGGASN